MDQVIPAVPVRQWVLSLPIPLRLLLAAQPRLITVVLQVVQRVIARFLAKQSQGQARQAKTGAVTLIQRFGSAANLNIHLHCLVLDGVYQQDDEGVPRFTQVKPPSDQEVRELLQIMITKLMKRLTRLGAVVQDEGGDLLGRPCRYWQRFTASSCTQAIASVVVYVPHCLRPEGRAEVAHPAWRSKAKCAQEKAAVRRSRRL